MSDAEKYGYSAFDDELQMQVKRERWKDAEIERLTAEIGRLEGLLHGFVKRCELGPEASPYTYEDLREALDSKLSIVRGWREYDHPEWFCRRTAEWLEGLE